MGHRRTIARCGARAEPASRPEPREAGAKRSERLDAAEHVRKDELSDDAVRGCQRGVGRGRRCRAPPGLTLELFQPPAPKRVRRQTALDISPDDLRGKSLDDALIFIAERNAGVLPSTAARELLVDAGVLVGSQVGNTLWNALDRSERFERESKGRYRLVDDLHDPVRLVS